jgi:hypothetical protein
MVIRDHVRLEMNRIAASQEMMACDSFNHRVNLNRMGCLTLHKCPKLPCFSRFEPKLAWDYIYRGDSDAQKGRGNEADILAAYRIDFHDERPAVVQKEKVFAKWPEIETAVNVQIEERGLEDGPEYK